MISHTGKASALYLNFQNLAFFLFQNIFFLFSNNIDRLVFFVPDYKNEAVWELLVVPKLNGRAPEDTSEGVWVDLPIPDRVAIKTHGSVGSLPSLV